MFWLQVQTVVWFSGVSPFAMHSTPIIVWRACSVVFLAPYLGCVQFVESSTVAEVLATDGSIQVRHWEWETFSCKLLLNDPSHILSRLACEKLRQDPNECFGFFSFIFLELFSKACPMRRCTLWNKPGCYGYIREKLR